MEIVKKLRGLGEEIQKDERYKAYAAAKEENDKDTKLQELIGEFNLKRMDLGRLMQEEGSDQAKKEKLDEEIKALYSEITSNEGMQKFSEAKENLDGMIKQINGYISLFLNGEDPKTCVYEDCGGKDGCGSCKGCK